jgi:hypothetical protein
LRWLGIGERWRLRRLRRHALWRKRPAFSSGGGACLDGANDFRTAGGEPLRADSRSASTERSRCSEWPIGLSVSVGSSVAMLLWSVCDLSLRRARMWVFLSRQGQGPRRPREAQNRHKACTGGICAGGSAFCRGLALFSGGWRRVLLTRLPFQSASLQKRVSARDAGAATDFGWLPCSAKHIFRGGTSTEEGISTEEAPPPRKASPPRNHLHRDGISTEKASPPRRHLHRGSSASDHACPCRDKGTRPCDWWSLRICHWRSWPPRGAVRSWTTCSRRRSQAQGWLRRRCVRPRECGAALC